LLLEQFKIGHARGSSHGQSRIFRFSYPDPAYVAMAIEAQGLWLELERAGERFGQVLIELGGLDVGDGIEANAAALGEYGAPFEMLTGADVKKRHPSVSVPDDLSVLWQPDGGIVAADVALETFIAVARRSGAEVRDKTPVASIEEGEGLVAVVVGNEKVYAEAIVVTAGAWVRGLVEPLGIDVPVRPTRETIAYFKVDGDIGPTFVEWSDPSVYALPSPRHNALKVGEHIAGPDADPDVDGEPDQSSIDRLAAWVAERYPSAEREPFLAETCFY
jgi:glycine/D-amino acid oxidase-like deaminating enzyme